MTIRFIHPTVAQVLKGISYVVALANLLLTYSATIQSLTWIPPGLAMYYPLIFGIALAIHQTASIFGITPAPLNVAPASSTVALLCVAALLPLSGCCHQQPPSSPASDAQTRVTPCSVVRAIKQVADIGK